MVFRIFEPKRDFRDQIYDKIRELYGGYLRGFVGPRLGNNTDFYNIRGAFLIVNCMSSINSFYLSSLRVGGNQSVMETIIEELDLKNTAEEKK